MSSVSPEPGAWPALTFISTTSRLTLVHPSPGSDAAPYAALLNHPSTSEFLPPFRSYLTQPISVRGAASILESHRGDASRLGFSLWLSSQDGVERSSTYVGTAGFTRIAVDPVTGHKHGEAGLLLSPSAHAQGLVSEILLTILDLGFRPSLEGPSAHTYGLGSDRVALGTSQRNSRLLYWIESVLELTPLPDKALFAGQKSDRAAWGVDALVFFHLYRESWETPGGKRETLRKRVIKRAQRNGRMS
jgi:RimJ/RimL family protein N-acetyltransferase